MYQISISLCSIGLVSSKTAIMPVNVNVFLETENRQLEYIYLGAPN